MRQFVRLVRISCDNLSESQQVNGLDAYETIRGLNSYIPQEPFASSLPTTVRAWRYIAVVTTPCSELSAVVAASVQPRLSGAQPEMLQLRPIGRLVPVIKPQARPETPSIVQSLRPVTSGQSYSIVSSQSRGLVAPELAEALQSVFERFARERGFTSEKPLQIRLSRGFKYRSPGHGEGRAADIAAIDGKTLQVWKDEWNLAMAEAEKLSDIQQREEAEKTEAKRNLGFGLYKALQEHGGWRVNPQGWRPYRGVMQLFGPWTATKGPWKTMEIKDPNPYQRQRLADQQWIFKAHQDHIHVAK